MRVLPVVNGVEGTPIMVGAEKNDDDDDGTHKRLAVRNRIDFISLRENLAFRVLALRDALVQTCHCFIRLFPHIST